MTDQRLLEIINKMKDTPVLVIGDLMLDRFVYGTVDRISPESPVPILAIQREDYMLGGAGNALATLHGLKANAHILSLIGPDEAGASLKSLIERMNISSDSLIEDETRPTTIKTRFLAGHQQLLRSDFERKDPASDKVIIEALSKVENALNTVKAIIISDYGKGFLRPDFVQSVIQKARTKNIPVIVDPKGKDFSLYKGATAITPNKKELAEATNLPVGSDGEVIEAANHLIQTCGVEAVIATRSGEGNSVIQQGHDPVHYRGAEIEVFDVSGAGDTVIATIAAALGAGADLVQAGALANIAGSIAVTKVGTTPVRADELITALKSGQADYLSQAGRERESASRTRQGDILGWEDAADLVRRWKARGLNVGFTNGCFDILHKGHVSYLNNTRDHCDRLIVGLNCDSSVKILKGESRPVHDEDARATVLAALGSVDLVVLFGAQKPDDDNTAIKLLEALKPSVYFKGGDYTEDQIPEAPTVRAYGGEVKVMPVYEGHSTTGSVEKIRAGKNA